MLADCISFDLTLSGTENFIHSDRFIDLGKYQSIKVNHVYIYI